MNRDDLIKQVQDAADDLKDDLVGKQILQLLVGASAVLHIDGRWRSLSDEQIVIELCRQAYVTGRASLKRILAGEDLRWFDDE